MSETDDLRRRGGALALALSKAQQAFPAVKKEQKADAGSFSYTYADLAAIFDAIRKPLADNELAIVQPIVALGEGARLHTILLHSSGESIESSYPLPDGLTAQQMGSAISYGRRYSLTSLLGIATEDDDGAQASASGKTTKKPAAKKAKPSSAEVSARARERERQQDARAKSEPEPVFGERQKAIMDLPAELGLTVEVAQQVWRDVVGPNVGVVDASPEQLDQFEASLRGTSEAQAAAFGTEQR